MTSPATFVVKGKDGLRYIGLITSNAYVDRDDEFVSEDALKQWVKTGFQLSDSTHRNWRYWGNS